METMSLPKTFRLERSPPDRGPRYYEIALTRDLWGAPVLLRALSWFEGRSLPGSAWGRVGGRRGGDREERIQSLTEARRAAAAWLRAERRRGYRRCDGRRGQHPVAL